MSDQSISFVARGSRPAISLVFFYSFPRSTLRMSPPHPSQDVVGGYPVSLPHRTLEVPTTIEHGPASGMCFFFYYGRPLWFLRPPIRKKRTRRVPSMSSSPF